MLSYKMDFSSCDIMPGFGKSSHNTNIDGEVNKFTKCLERPLYMHLFHALQLHGSYIPSEQVIVG